MFTKINPNPNGVYVGDCVIRAIATAREMTWEKTYMDLCLQGFMMADMPSSNHVWGSYLQDKGYIATAIPNTCPHCYTIKDFCDEYTEGTYILATGTHVVAVKDGDYYDSWDSGDEVPILYWQKEE